MDKNELGFNQISRSDIFWGYVAQVFNIGAGLLLLPIILIYFTQAEVGLWFVFLTIGSLTQLLELGFKPTIARNTAYIISGAKDLKPYGIPNYDEVDGVVDKQLLSSLITTAKKIYLVVSLLGVIVITFGGGSYIITLIKDFSDPLSALIAWAFFSSGRILNFYFGYVDSLLLGKGNVTKVNKVVIISKIAYISISVLAIMLGFGLVGLGVATLISALIGRLVALSYLNRDELLMQASSIKTGRQRIFSILWPNTKKLGIVNIGAFLIQRFSVLLASSYLGLEVAASYGMTITILMTLMAVSSTICQVHVPLLSHLQSKNKKEEIKSVLGEIYLISWFVFFIGLALMISVGNLLLGLIGSDTEFLPDYLVLMLGIFLFLELTHSVSATYITTTNNIPFLKSALWSGLFVAVAGFLLVQPLGVLGLILAQGTVQLAYNNWKWPLAALNDLNDNLINVLYLGTLRIKSRL